MVWKEDFLRRNRASRAARRAEDVLQAEGGALPPRPSHQPRQPVQLPLWPEPVRAVPNSVLRSALFAVGGTSKGKQREHLESVEIAAVNGVTVHYSGARLDQSDLDVWETVLHAVRQQAMGDKCRITAYSLLKLMGKTDTGGEREQLKRRISRLVGATVEIQTERYSYIGTLIRDAAQDKRTKEWVIEVNPKLRPLFAPDQFTQVQWAVRQELGRNQLAKWLHGFYSSHAKPHPIKAEKLLHLAGSANKRSGWTQEIRKALTAIAAASAKHGEEFAFEVKDGMVYVERHPSRSQRRHLRRKGAG